MGRISYRLASLPKVKEHDVFHISLLKKYANDVNNVVDWSMIQVESGGELQPEPLCILDHRPNALFEPLNKLGCNGGTLD